MSAERIETLPRAILRSRDPGARLSSSGMYQRLYYHLVWTTLDRRPLIDAGLAGFLCRSLRAIAGDEGARILEVGMVQTHVHTLIAAPLKTDWARLIQRLKGASSYLANRDGLAGSNGPLRWARGYSVSTVSPAALETARRYLQSQPRHHPNEAIDGWNGDRGREAEWRDSGRDRDRGARGARGDLGDHGDLGDLGAQAPARHAR